MESFLLDVGYWREKDILQIDILPRRPSKWHGNHLDFFVRYDWDNSDQVVGFEILDFGSRFIPHLYNPDAIPEQVLAMRFNIEEAGLHNVDIRQVLEWAYQRHVVKERMQAVA